MLDVHGARTASDPDFDEVDARVHAPPGTQPVGRALQADRLGAAQSSGFAPTPAREVGGGSARYGHGLDARRLHFDDDENARSVVAREDVDLRVRRAHAPAFDDEPRAQESARRELFAQLAELARVGLEHAREELRTPAQEQRARVSRETLEQRREARRAARARAGDQVGLTSPTFSVPSASTDWIADCAKRIRTPSATCSVTTWSCTCTTVP